MITNKQRVQFQPAYVLHQRPYKDASAIVEIFSAEYGRHGLVANGIKRSTSKRRGLVQSFQPLLISWVGRGELGTLTAIELRGHALILKPQYFCSAFYMNELLLRLLQRHDPHVELFSCYDKALRALAVLPRCSDANWPLQAILRSFEVSLLQLLGYALVLGHDIKTNEPINVEYQYDYLLDHGPTRYLDSSIEPCGVVVSGLTLKALSNPKELNGEISVGDSSMPLVFNEAKRLLRSVLDAYLGHKPLQSREMYRKTKPLAG
ncbi:MAG: DNA repair protein RecO [Gammaproteobacteria bacterium]|nr:DNA repair protein RecO [Gammaproteobacteria bacterium]